MDSQHLLVPIKVQALVIDDIVINKSGVLEFENRYVANDGRWSPQVYNYQQLLGSLRAPGPRPFYGATRKYQGRDADQLVLDPNTNKEALPQMSDRGVYLHWVLPSGLRRAYTPGQLDFPPLPDHWLIVRFARGGATLKTRAWFVDGAAVVGDGAPANLLVTAADKYVAKRVGKVVPLEEFATADFSGERTAVITAVGNDYTGSPTFTASIAENRNIFSWHDKLEDLRTPNSDGKVPEDTTLTYCVLGWYRDAQQDPLSSPKAKVVERTDANGKFLGWLIDPPGWSIDAKSTAPVELLKQRSVFHGMVAHINYWSGQTTYKGHMLGYPGAPLVGGAMGGTTPAFKVGVGNSAEDALVSLVSSEYSGEQQPGSLAKEQPNLWKALEAVVYRQAETLVRSWNVAPRDMTVHQNSFATHEAGKIWYIRPLADNSGVFPADAKKTAEETAAEPTAEQLTKLKDLNQLQSELDTVSRDLVALQQELYARWWKLCAKSRTFDSIQTDLNECTKVANELTALRDKLNGLKARLQPLPAELETKLAAEKKFELKYDAAPRFWLPSDPVIIVKNSGSPSKHQFSREHACRLPEQIITSGKVKVGTDTNTLNTPAGVADIATAALQHLPSCPPVLTALLNEASIVEQTIRNLVERSLPPEKAFRDQGRWSDWTKQLVHDLTWDGDENSFPRYQVTFEPEALNIRPFRLVDLWVQQPWSPLFIDWQITWFPTASTAEQSFGPVWNFVEADFVPLDRKSIPSVGYTVRGRSLLSPIDERILQEPVETLGKLLKSARNSDKKDSNYPPAVLDVLERYEVVWSKTVCDLPRGGLMGQALTGFHQALLRRDVTFPRITPDSARPWIKTANLKTFENEVRALLDIQVDAVTVERLAPPSPAPTTAAPGVPFSLIRAGALRIDELWLVDDFGQSADILGLTAARSTSSGQVFHPRMRWHDDPQVFAMPPRVLQPVRLNFRFTPAAENRNAVTNSEPALNSICGWIFYNTLDKALVLCDRKGELIGHLKIVRHDPGFRITWEPGAAGVALANVINPTLKQFAESFIETASNPKLLELLNLIDHSLQRIRPAAARRDTVLVGRPLALVSASVGLELFGKPWSSPHKPPVEGPGSAELSALRVRVNLGDLHSVEDGLIGYFKDGAYNRIVVPQLSEQIKASDYIRDPKADGLRAGFGAAEKLTLLMDPWGSVQAACGLVPAKTITLAHPELDKIAGQMEASFRVGPVLLSTGRLALPAPTGNKGSWNFAGPLTEQKPAALIALDPRYFSDEPIVATEGRLLLLND